MIEIEAFGASEEAIERVRQATGVTSVAVEEREQAQLVLVRAGQGQELTQPLVSALDGTRLGRISTREPTLEDAYVALVDDAS